MDLTAKNVGKVPDLPLIKEGLVKITSI